MSWRSSLHQPENATYASMIIDAVDLLFSNRFIFHGVGLI